MAITVDVVAPSPVFVGSPYTGQCTASGGVAPYTYAITAGALPNGVSLDAATGGLTGSINDTPGSFDATVTATDSTLATGDGDIPIVVEGVLSAPSAAVVARVPIQWSNDDCLPGGRQFARLFFDAIQQQNFTTILRGNLQQNIGLVKSLLFHVYFKQPFVPADPNGPLDTLIIESSLTLQRVALGCPLFGPTGLARTDFYLNGCVPFIVNDEAPVNIWLETFGQVPTASEINVRLFFANFEIAPFFFPAFDNTGD